MPDQSATITAARYEDKPAISSRLFGLPQHEAVPAAAEPEQAPDTARRELTFPEIFPVYSFL